MAPSRRIAPNIERGGQAFLAGAIGGALQLVAGITGPLLDILYVRAGMTRQVNVANKVAYFGGVIEGPAGSDPEQWLVMAYAACFAVLGTSLSRGFLDRMSDKQFYHWTRRVILGLGAIYVGQGIWLMVPR